MIWTNYVKVKINKTLQNCKCILSKEINEAINQTIRECSKPIQKKFETT